MSKESLVIQELANNFPSWSKIRTDIDSNGQRLLNSAGLELEDLDKILIKIDKNVHITTFNLDEIDQLYKIDLTANTDLQEQFTNTNITTYTVPTITGILDSSIKFSIEDVALGNTSSNVIVDVIEDGNLKTFWEESLPNAFISGSSITGVMAPVTKNMIELDSITSIDHPLKIIRGGGSFYFNLVSKYPYIKQGTDSILRSRIVISGETRKGLAETETIVFPWTGFIRSKKEWKKIDSITSFDTEDPDGSTATLEIRGDNCLQDEYLSQTNLKWSQNRNKIDEFWRVNLSSSSLERIEYSTDNWRLLLEGSNNKIPKDRWRLENSSGQLLTNIKDLELLPFKEMAWILTEDKLYLYNLDKNLKTRIDYIQKNTTKDSTTSIIIDVEDVVLTEKTYFSLFRKKLDKRIASYHAWYINPNDSTDTKNDISGTSSSHTINSSTNRILFAGELAISLKGEYIFGVDVLFEDGTTETVADLLNVKSKEPLKSFNLSDLGITNPVGLFFDSDQKLWIKTTTTYEEIRFYKNKALIDHTRKNIYFLEKYKSLAVNYP